MALEITVLRRQAGGLPPLATSPRAKLMDKAACKAACAPPHLSNGVWVSTTKCSVGRPTGLGSGGDKVRGGEGKMDELQAQRNVTTANSAKHLLLALSTSRCWAGCLLPEPLGYSPLAYSPSPFPYLRGARAFPPDPPLRPHLFPVCVSAARHLRGQSVQRSPLAFVCARDKPTALSLSVRRKNSVTSETGALARGFTQTLATICWVNSLFGQLVPPTMVSRCAREDGDGRGWVEGGRKTGGYV